MVVGSRDHDPVPSLGLGLEEGTIGKIDGVVERGPELGGGDTEAHRERWHRGALLRSRKLLAQPVDHDDRVGNRALGDHEDELFTAVARRDVVGAQAVAHHAGEETQCPIAGVVPVDVVELLEVVEVAVGDDVRPVRRW